MGEVAGARNADDRKGGGDRGTRYGPSHGDGCEPAWGAHTPTVHGRLDERTDGLLVLARMESRIRDDARSDGSPEPSDLRRHR